MVLVGDGILELVKGNGPVWFFYVLCQPPEDQEVLDVVLHAPEGSESKVGLFGLRCKVKQGEKGRFHVEWFEVVVEVLSVFSE